MGQLLDRDKRAARGGAAIEFVLVLPLVAVLVMGLVDFGQILHMRLTLIQAVREGARLAVNGADDAEIRSGVEHAAAPLALTAFTVARVGDRTTVSAETTFDAILWKRDGATIIRRDAVARVSP